MRSFNNILRKEEYPDMFCKIALLKFAKVASLHKRGSKQSLDDYGPISVLTPINKIYETLLKKSFQLNFGKSSIYFLIINLGLEKDIQQLWQSLNCIKDFYYIKILTM